MHLDGTNAVTHRNLWSQAVDQLLAVDRVTEGTARTIWPLTDHQGTVRNLYGLSGGVYKVYAGMQYDSFGRPQADSFDIGYLYAGQQWDWETNLQYSRARYYDPQARQFISQDPIGFAAGDTNLYRRVGNSPINATDPSGKIIFLPVLAAWGIKGAIAYFATQAVISGVETAIEVGATHALGGETSWSDAAAGFGKNLLINSATGGIGSKGKYVYKAAAWAGRQGLEIGGDTAFDTLYRGQDFTSSLIVNSIGSVAGEAGGKVLAAGLSRGLNSAAGQVTTAFAHGFVEGLSRRGALYSRIDIGIGSGLTSGFRHARNAADDLYEPSRRAFHDRFVQQVRPGAKEQSFPTPWSRGKGLGSRRFDDFDHATGTAFEGNTTPWSRMTQEQLSRKLDQVGSDYALLQSSRLIQRIVWFGTEELPTSGLGGQLSQALYGAGIPYWAGQTHTMLS